MKSNAIDRWESIGLFETYLVEIRCLCWEKNKETQEYIFLFLFAGAKREFRRILMKTDGIEFT